ncbi:uncharacterized protein ACR2FA_010778 [Aphomia sociella]
MSCTVKCIGCNIVIDELLAYLKAKLSKADEESLVKLCTSTFSSEDIQKSHSLLFESVPSELRKISRKGKGKEDRLVFDMLHFLKVTEPDKLPVFVARDLDKLPNLTMDHLDVSKLLKDMALLQADVMQIKTSYVTAEQLESAKKECLNNKILSPPFSAAKINMKRGAYRDSGPIGLSIFDESHTNNDEPLSLNNFSLHYRNIKYKNIEGKSDATQAVASLVTDCSSDDSPPPAQSDVPTIVQRPADQPSADVTNEISYAQAVEIGKNEWTVVQKKVKKSKNRVEGKSGIAVIGEDETFRAAERKSPVFITNIHQNTCESDIVRYIYKMTQETVKLEKISIQRHCNYNAYKFYVPQSKLSKFLDEKIWPQGIIFRRFFNFKLSRKMVPLDKGVGSSRENK